MRKTYGPGYPRTLGALMAWSGLDPEAPAVTDAAGTLDRRAFQNRVLRLAAGLRRGGVGSGSRVALWLPNGSGYLAAIFACARLGALAIHINTRFRKAEVGNLLRRSRAVALVTQWGFPPVDFPAIFAALPVEDRAGLGCVLGLQLPPGMTQLAGLPVLSLDGDAADAGPDEAAGEKPCLTFTTSGTTGGPKLVLHDQQAIAGHAADVARHIGLGAPDAVLLAAVPFCGTFGNAAAMAAIAGGAHVVCLAQFDAQAAVRLIRQHRVTHVIGGDDMFGRIAAASGGRRFDSVRFSGFAAFYSSAAASIAAAEAAGMQPHGLYGSSEVQALFSVSEGENRLLGGGVPVSIQARLAVLDPKTGNTLPSGASGELWIDAPSRFIEYLEDPAATERAIDTDGMFRTGDLARLAGTSFVYEARIGDAMRLGGFLVSPEEIEAVIQAHPGVAGVQVVAASRGGADPVPVAFVRPAAGTELDETALRARCLEQLARFKVPERIVVVEAFPIVDSPNGPKVQRVRLREMAELLLREQRHNQLRDVPIGLSQPGRREVTMKGSAAIATAAALLLACAFAAQAQEKVSDGVVKIGMLEDMSSIYADITGVGAVTAAKMAVEDFGGKVLGKPIEVIAADHQNKPDILSATAREWFDTQHVDALLDVAASATALAAIELAKAKNKIVVLNGPGATRITNEACTPVSIHYTYDNYALSHGTGAAIVKAGYDTWFFLTADYAFGHDLEAVTAAVVRTGGGKVLGSVRVPINTLDFSSALLQAQSSKAKVIGLANAGADTTNSIKQAAEFGIVRGGQKLAGLLVFINDINTLGLEAAQGMLLTNAFYWDRNEESRAWAQRYFQRMNKMPNMTQAGIYSATTHYLKAVEAARTDATQPVIEKMRSTPINDFFVKNGKIREDGRMVHEMYLYEVKKPAESKGAWDYYKLVATIPADQAFQPLSESKCPLVKKAQ